MDFLQNELGLGPDGFSGLLRIGYRLIAAGVLAAVIGYERETAGKAAGLRTHTLVAIGTAVFILAGIRTEMSTDGLSRVIQGIITGIGFIGAGSILKNRIDGDVSGITTSAGVWVASAIGAACGLGQVGLGVVGTVLAFLVLKVLVGADRPKSRLVHSTDLDSLIDRDPNGKQEK